MTMVRQLGQQYRRTVRVVGVLMRVALPALVSTAPLSAQGPPVHFHHAGAMPPGAIGSLRLQRGGPLSGYFQPVEIRAPSGVLVSTAQRGQFDPPQPAPWAIGMQIGPVYRLRVTHIPLHPGEELYPTVELIDRIYPPPGETRRFPIPIELAKDDLELALEGAFVTRIVYVEDPDRALPEAAARDRQHWFEAAPEDDPLAVADRLGRPVAIVRIGARVPEASGPDEQFLFGSPPLLRYQASPRPKP